MDKMLGAISAAPTPCATRAATSTAGSGARAHAAEVATKIAIPRENTRRRPNWSPRRPPVTSRTAVEIVYPATTHSMAPSPAPRPCWMDGSATFTMKKSRTNMNVPNISTVSADQDGADGARQSTCCGHTPSLLPPVTGESNGLEDRPADLGAVPGQVGFGERHQVVLADRPVHSDRPFGDHRAEPAVGLVDVPDRPRMDQHRRFHAGDGQRPDPPVCLGSLVH